MGKLRKDSIDDCMGATNEEIIDSLQEDLEIYSLKYRSLERELAEAKQTNRDWIRENAPGGWIDNLRVQLAEVKRRSGIIRFTCEVPDEYLGLGQGRSAYDYGYKAGFRGLEYRQYYCTKLYMEAFDRGYMDGDSAARNPAPSPAQESEVKSE